MNAPTRKSTFTTTKAGHAYSATCNCDECFETWMAMPPPSQEEQQRMARAFSLALAPSGGGELPTDWPRLASDAELLKLAKAHRTFERQERRRGGRA